MGYPSLMDFFADVEENAINIQNNSAGVDGLYEQIESLPTSK